MGIKEFKEKINQDKLFADKFKDVKTPEEFVEIAAAEGFTFTVDDLKNSVSLTDEELDAVDGGSFFDVLKASMGIAVKLLDKL